MRFWTFLVIGVLASAAAGYGQVWQSTFPVNGGFDGMTNFQNLNGSGMLNPSGASGGILQVLATDTSPGQNDKSGRLLGATANAGSTSFSAYYKFAWSQLAETSSEVWTGATFMGDSQTNWTREVMGALFRHYKDTSTGHYFVNLGGIYGGVGIDYAGYHSGGFIDLGPSAVGTTYQLVVSWNNANHHLHNALYSASGALLSDMDSNLDSATDYPNLHILSQATLNAEINATNIKYLGWEDYVGNANQQSIIWDTDTVAYFNTANGAFTMVPEPSAALLLAGGLFGLVPRRKRC